MRHFFIILALLLMVGCNGEPPPPPPGCQNARETWPECEGTGGEWVLLRGRLCDCDCPDDGVFIEDKGCEVAPPPPPPTTTTVEPERKPEEYITLDRGVRIIHDVQVESRSKIWLSSWSGIVDERSAANKCPDLVEEVLGLTPAELHLMADEGQALLDRWNRKWRINLSTLNKRADEYEAFRKEPLRSNVLKTNWDPYLARLKAHRKQANLNRTNGRNDPEAKCAFDSIQGWCGCRNRLRD